MVTCGRYLKQCPIPVYRLRMDPGTKEPPYLDIGISRLYDTWKDPAQQDPITDKEREEKMCRELAVQMKVHDAPEEQFQRLGLEQYKDINTI